MPSYFLDQSGERITVKKFDLDPMVYENDLYHRKAALLKLRSRLRRVRRAAMVMVLILGGSRRWPLMWLCLRHVVIEV
jgi:predicted transposase YdaD